MKMERMLELLIRCRKLLEELEWANWDMTKFPEEKQCVERNECPNCGETKHHKHDCELANLLQEIKS